MHVYLTKTMARFVRRENLGSTCILEAVERAERGLIDADLGGGLIKQRIARKGSGRSGGYRTIIAYRRAGRAVFLYGFAKSEKENIAPHELTELRKIGANWLNASANAVAEALDDQALEEVEG